VSAALEQALLSHDLKLNICYCSVVGECWKTDLATISLNPQPVRACARPQVPFDLRHPTRSKPHHRRCHSSAATSPTLLSMRDIKHRAHAGVGTRRRAPLRIANSATAAPHDRCTGSRLTCSLSARPAGRSCAPGRGCFPGRDSRKARYPGTSARTSLQTRRAYTRRDHRSSLRT